MGKIFLGFIFLVLMSCNFEQEKKHDIDTEEDLIERAEASYNPEAKLQELGLELSTPSAPVANYVNAVRTGNLIFLAGKGPRKVDGQNITGKLGADLTIEQGYEAARLTGVNQLSVLKAELGNLNKVKRIVKVKGMVNSIPDFKDHPKVVNGYSDLMVEVFGERGKHARAAVGMGSLPSNIAVEIEMIVEIFED
ncbi:RidA family protein [Maribacter sp. HTCC2170]|uniref:RidA family protein n=1 Tax=Maribacter sp. (strain HTCC2170 / KCCM 42371) TaxID=313603 RepID=UPI00006BD460|nr:RidA family protein [Maribacter sp. HTCC2170]EAR02519.1 transcription regulator [Maribacter sp. HTCC2170]